MNKINTKQKKLLGVILIIVTIVSGCFLQFKGVYSLLFSIFITLPVYLSCICVYYICILTNYSVGTIMKIMLSFTCTMGAGALNLCVYANVICRLYLDDIENQKYMLKICYVFMIFQVLLIINIIIYDRKIKNLKI